MQDEAPYINVPPPPKGCALHPAINPFFTEVSKGWRFLPPLLLMRTGQHQPEPKSMCFLHTCCRVGQIQAQAGTRLLSLCFC